MFNFFQAYASGCNIVILSPKFERVQIIPGVCHDNIQISCLDCSVDSGKIAAAYANQIIVFEPTTANGTRFLIQASSVFPWKNQISFLRFLVQQNTALFSTFLLRPSSVRPSQA